MSMTASIVRWGALITAGTVVNVGASAAASDGFEWMDVALRATCCDDPPPVMGPPPPPDGIGNAVFANGKIVWFYDPDPAVVRPESSVPRSRFPSIDVHCHWSVHTDPVAMIAAMDERNVRRAINLSGGMGAELEAMIERFERLAPDRFSILCNVDWSRAADADFAETVTAELQHAKRSGAAGLKVFKSLGLTVRDATGERVAIDDPRLDVVWRTCAELDMPVLIHSADPIAFFDPIDERNERWMQLARHPSWSFHGPQFPSWSETIAEFERMVRRNRGTTFIAAHVGNCAEHLSEARRMLEDHPNVFMDISGRVGELGRRPFSARRLFLDFPERLLFGTDRYPGRPDQPRYRVYYRFLETDDEYFKYYVHPFPVAGDWRIHGVFLPDEVLRNVYHDNAARIFGWPVLADDEVSPNADG